MGTKFTEAPASAVLADPGDVAAPAVNTAAVVTYGAVAGQSHAITGVAYSYNAAPTGGNLKIEDGAGTTVFSMDIVAAGPGVVLFNPAKIGTAGRAMIITLTAAGAAVTGKISILNHWVE
jgi:hypothetical protein